MLAVASDHFNKLVVIVHGSGDSSLMANGARPHHFSMKVEKVEINSSSLQKKTVILQ